MTAGDVDAALRVIDAELPQLILLDLLMPGRNGIELLAELADRGLQIPVIVLTATKTVATAVEAMKSGAVDFITKPFELDALRMKVRQLLAHGALEEEVARLREEVRDRQQLRGLVGNSPAIREIFRGIERVAPSLASVAVDDPDPGEQRNREGAGSPGDPRAESASRRPVRGGQLRRDSPQPDRE